MGRLVTVLLSSVFAFLCFLHLFYLCLFGIFLLLLSYWFPVSFSILLNSSHYIIFIFLVFLYFVFCSHDAVCLFLCIFQYSLFEYLASFRFFKVMLSCGIVIFHSSPTNKTSAKTALIIFNIFTFSVFELLSVLAWAFFHKNHFTVFNTELIKRFHRVNMVFLGICIVYIDKIYNLFYVLPFFDSVFQLFNRCSNYFNQH